MSKTSKAQMRRANKLFSLNSQRPLTAAMDNILATRLGEIAARASQYPFGDNIDRGLVLLRLLNENGFAVTHPGV